jgi:hypothetical protein
MNLHVTDFLMYIVSIHVQKAHGLVAHMEAHNLGPALARPGPLPMGPCQPA